MLAREDMRGAGRRSCLCLSVRWWYEFQKLVSSKCNTVLEEKLDCKKSLQKSHRYIDFSLRIMNLISAEIVPYFSSYS